MGKYRAAELRWIADEIHKHSVIGQVDYDSHVAASGIIAQEVAGDVRMTDARADLETFKAEVREELVAQRKKQEEMTARQEALEAKLDTILAKQDIMASDIKSCDSDED